MLSPKQIQQFQTYILDWYQSNKRDLPWRTTRDPYTILVSEVMLQQTQVGRVIPKYASWLHAFPTIDVLANAPASEVLRHWSGLGYNRRAIFLQKAVKVIVHDYKGSWPQTVEKLQTLPGIGKYTASALSCFAFDTQVAVVDTNVRKVILTEFGQNHPEQGEGSYTFSEKDIERIAQQLLPKGKAYEWNQALMDYASLVLKEQKIPLKKQSKFIGSNRFYRGKIVRVLLDKHALTVSELAQIIVDKHAPRNQGWFEALIDGLIKDGLIKMDNEKLALM